MSRQNSLSYRLEHRPGQQGPLKEVRSAPTVVRASAYPEDHAEEDGNEDVASACQVGNCSIDRCGHRRCLTCPALDNANSFTSSISSKTYKVLGTRALAHKSWRIHDFSSR